MPNGSKNWVWTLNNYTEETVDRLRRLGEDSLTIQYLVFGIEVGESGTPHLQGFVQFCSRKTMQQVKLWMQDNTVHLEIMKGTAQQAAAYCRKDNKFYEFGELIKKGQRKDLEEIKKKIDDGANLTELWDTHFSVMCQYRKGFSDYIDLKRSSKPREVPRVFVFWGPSGTGKTRRAWEINPKSTWVYPSMGWFDGYAEQEVAIFDEFDGSDIKFSFWKQLVDRYPIRVPIKGGFTAWRPRIIVFTSNVRPSEWWRDERLPLGHSEQFNRRVERVVEMTEQWDPTQDPINFE